MTETPRLRRVGQQFFSASPKRGSGDGPRRFATRAERHAAWQTLPRDWRAPLEQPRAAA